MGMLTGNLFAPTTFKARLIKLSCRRVVIKQKSKSKIGKGREKKKPDKMYQGEAVASIAYFN